jgi:hypothetical protein
MVKGPTKIRAELIETRFGGRWKGTHHDTCACRESGQSVGHDGAQAALHAVANHGTSHCLRNSETGHALRIAG